jgi:Mn2+/Fe2+ NRAMP family transporter
LAILITAAATLHAGGVTDIQTTAQAAQALRPIAGPLAKAIFALGVVGTGLLSVPVLAGSAATPSARRGSGRQVSSAGRWKLKRSMP